jgi:hypothetical protein
VNSPTVKLSLDHLEAREVPATVTLVGSQLQVTGDDAANAVVVVDDGHGDVTATITTGATVVSGGGKGVSKIVIRGNGGDDTLDYRLTATMLRAEDLDIDMGAGNDRVRMDLYRGISGVPLNLSVAGGAGNDSAEIRFGTINNANVNVHAALGAGADTFSLIMFSGLTGNSHMTVDAAGNGGADKVDMNLMGKIDAGATLDIHAANSADANDRLVVRYKGELDGKLNVTVDQAAVDYGVQGYFALDPASTGKVTATVNDGHLLHHSSVVVTDHTGGPKVSVLDRLGETLTESVGMKATY